MSNVPHIPIPQYPSAQLTLWRTHAIFWHPRIRHRRGIRHGPGRRPIIAGNSSLVSVPGSSPIPVPTPDAFDIGFTIAAVAAVVAVAAGVIIRPNRHIEVTAGH